MSKLKSIKDYYVAAFQAINGTGGYVNTVAAINQRTVNKLAEVSKGAAEIFVQIKAKKDTGPNTTKKRVRTATVIVTGQITNPLDAANNDAAIFSLDADVEKAAGADLHCGGAAITSRPIGTSFIYGDPSVQLESTIEVQYVDEVTP